jgi:hypothetical protein
MMVMTNDGDDDGSFQWDDDGSDDGGDDDGSDQLR